MTDINKRLTLSLDDRNLIEHLEVLLEQKLHLVTVVIFVFMYFYRN